LIYAYLVASSFTGYVSLFYNDHHNSTHSYYSIILNPLQLAKY